VRNSSGQIVCRINQTTVTDPRCVPINVFGNGAPSQAALDYVNTTSFVKSTASELDALAFVGGDTSQVFNLPGGPISFVLGGEYRREKAYQVADPLSASGGTFFNAFSTFDPPSFTVKEAFGELQIPLLRDLPFAKELSFSAAGRISNYNTSAGTTKAFNLSGVYAPTSDIRVRANLSRSVRVPTLGDLFSTPGQNFGFVQDPCDVQYIGTGTTNRAANCAALGVPVGFVNTVARSQTIGFLSGGNPNLTPEVGKSLTLGTVVTPRFIPGFSLTVDYYRIRVNNLIATLGAQTILNQCVDLPTINNQYCAVVFPRNSDSTFATPTLLSSGINFAKYAADGIDFELAYRKTFANGHRFDFHGILTKVIRRTNFTSPTDPKFGDRILSELGDPAYAANASINYTANKLGIRYSVNYFSHQTIGAYENYFSFEGRPPQNADLTSQVYYPSALYHAVKLTFDATKKYQFYVGVDNLFNKKPPFGLLGNEGGNAYDPYGRYMYAGAKLDF
jgi:outer membrane receptor protein involved in Fe transport